MNTKRALIIMTVIATVASGAAFYHKGKSQEYKQTVENAYQRAFIELVDYAGNIDVILNKALVSNDHLKLADLSEQLWSETALAKSALGQLPIASTELDKTSAFITQVSDYVHTINKKFSNGEPITDKERKQIATLVKYSDALNRDLKELEDQFINGNLQLSAKQIKTAFADGNITNINDSMGAIEKSFEDYPTIIYDGPFAEHILNRKSEILNQPGISMEYALSVAEKFTGKKLEFSGESNGSIPSYIFISKEDELCIEISKNGGKVVMLTDGTTIKNPEIEIEQAYRIASVFLENNGYKNMQQTGYIVDGNAVNFAFANTLDGYTIYSDLIKIKISLHDGAVCGFEANGFLFNNKWRVVPKPLVSQNSVISKLNPTLKVEKINTVCIPRDNGTECWCYEVKARYENKTFLIYVNTQNGDEEEILLYVEDENGNLTI